MKKHLGFLFNILAICLFIPGITLPIFSIYMEVTAQVGAATLSSDLVNKELSLLGTINELWLDQRFFVASALFTFSIVIPAIKALLVSVAYFIKNIPLAKRIINFISVIGKWSMADVFVVAVFLAVFSTNHADTASEQTLNLFAFKLDVLFSSATLSNAGSGLYYFTGYCLLSILGTQLSQSAIRSK